MRHVRQVSVARAAAVSKAMDPAGSVFLQIWAWVMSFVLSGAFGSKG